MFPPKNIIIGSGNDHLDENEQKLDKCAKHRFKQDIHLEEVVDIINMRGEDNSSSGLASTLMALLLNAKQKPIKLPFIGSPKATKPSAKPSVSDVKGKPTARTASSDDMDGNKSSQPARVESPDE
eukprot:133759_1